MITEYRCTKCKAIEPDILIEVAVSTTAVAKMKDGKYEVIDELNTISIEYLCQDCYIGEFGV